METKAIILRGGNDTERLYLHDLCFGIPETGEKVEVKKTFYPNLNMTELIARHKGRYCLLGLYCRPGYKMLDFPCGSGYASEFLKGFSVLYEGREFDRLTVEYAKRIYGNENISFSIGDLTKPNLPKSYYEVIGCIEGLEHIDKEYQLSLIEFFYKALKKEGVLVVSSPENPTGVSGPSIHNKDHKWELVKKDFIDLLSKVFGKDNVELVSHKAKLSTGVVTNCLYGVCHKI